MRQSLHSGLVALISIGLATAAFAQSTAAKPVAQKPASAAAKAAPKAAAKNTPPPAIDAAFKKAYPTATVKDVAKEKDKDGKDVYEVESVDKGMKRDLIYRPDGTVVEYEEQVAESSVPAAVMSAIKARYPKATVTLAEKVFKDNTVNFELSLKGAAVKAVELTPEGKWIGPAPAAKK